MEKLVMAFVDFAVREEAKPGEIKLTYHLPPL